METKIINGTFSGTDANGIIQWECPINNKQLTCQGEFNYDKQGYWHDVYDADENYMYTVIAS